MANPGLTVIWTAHQLRTSNETFKAMLGMTRRPLVRPHVLRPRMTNGEGEIPFVNGSRILFGARERGFGLGFADVGMLIFDEGQRATVKALDDLIPTTNTNANPLVFVIGTPPRPTDQGEVFHRRRADAIAGLDDQLYLEFGADPGCDPRLWPTGHVDWAQVAAANPSYPLRTPRASILRMLRMLGPESFRREGLGIWDSDTLETSTIAAGTWSALAGTAPSDGLTCYAVRFSVNRESVALAAAIRPTGGRPHVEVIDERPATSGVSWLVNFLVPRWQNAAQIVVDGKSGAGALVTTLREAGVGRTTLLQPTVDQVITAHALTLDLVTSSGMTHGGQPGLDAQVARAAQRTIGNAGGWGWRSITGESITSWDAATYALWAAMTTKRRPGRGGGAVL
ncbi:MAG: hypothetical protein QM695_15880 [Micropruina sp.]